MRRRQVFVAGTWRTTTAAEYAEQARRIGELIAQAGYDLGCGPGTGISAHAIAGYRSVPGRPGRVRFMLPAAEHMAAAGEEVRAELADDIEQTDLDYPMRNLRQVKRSDGVVVVTGGDGTLEEILPALIDYLMPVGVIAGSGPAAVALERLLPLFPEWRPLVCLEDDPTTVARFVLDSIAARPEDAGGPQGQSLRATTSS